MEKIYFLCALFISAMSFGQENGNQGKTNTEVIYQRDAGFPGGQTAMDKFINENIQYPQESIDKIEEGVISVMFTVNADGTITDVFAGQNTMPLLATEAVRLVKSMPNWEPAIMNGTAIKQQVYAPIPFLLSR